MKKVLDIVQAHVGYGKVSTKGFHQLKCPICHDYQPRLGIKLEGDNVGANCFNCGFKARYSESDGRLSKNFKKLLKAFGVPEEEIEAHASQSFFQPKSDAPITLESITKVNLYAPEIKLPDHSYRIKLDNCPLENAYLRSRKLDYSAYPFYVSSDKKLKNRIIIPFYRNGKVIYWQARSILDERPRYKNCDVSKEAVMFGMDRLWFNSLRPLFISEGVFDALHVDGVALIGSTINEAKRHLLQQSRRDKIFVIDYDKNGCTLAENVIQYHLGKLTTLGPGLDINKSVNEYGKLWTFYKLIENVPKTEVEQKLFMSTLRARV